LKTVCFKDPLNIVAFSAGNNYVFNYPLQNLNSAYSIGTPVTKSDADPGNSIRSIDYPGTNYVYYASSNDKYFGRLDSSGSMPTYNTGINDNDLQNPSNLCLVQSKGFVAALKYDGNKITYAQISNLAASGKSTLNAQVNKGKFILANNLNDKEMYLLGTGGPGTTLYFHYYSLTGTLAAGGGTMNLNFAGINMGTSTQYNLINMGPYQYLAFFRGNPHSFTMMNKQNGSTTAFTMNAAVTSNVEALSMVGSLRFSTGPDRVYFGLFEGTKKNFQSYYVQFGYCANRPTSDWICTICYTGYYRTNLTANNDCITKLLFPAGFGADETNNLVLACTVANCVACVDDYTICTACNTVAEYYLNTVANLCQNAASMTAGYGPNLGTGIIQLCSASNCPNCFWDYSTCTPCDTANSYYKNVTDGTCVNIASLAVNYGMSTANNQVIAPCSESHCTNCAADYTTCLGCDTANLYFLNLATHQCKLNSTLDNGYGPDLTTGKVETCVDTHCLNCRPDIQYCYGCDTANGYYLDTTTYTCTHYLSIATGYGANLGTGQIALCVLSNCVNCQQDNSVCTICDTANSYYRNVTDGTCVNIASLAVNYGMNTANNQEIAPCSESHCTNCAADYTTCLGCDTANLYFLNLATHQCKLNSTLDNGYGPDLTTGKVETCVDTHCLNCRPDIQYCYGCDTANGYYLDTTTYTCTHYLSIATGYGANLGTGQIALCVLSNCVNCQQDNSVCTTCDTANSYYKNVTDGTCVNIASLAVNYGMNTANNQEIAPCSESHCTNCAADYTTCLGCDTANLYFLNLATHQCKLNSTLANGYGPDLTTGKVETCVDTHCLNCRPDIQYCYGCDTANGYYLDTTTYTCTHYLSIATGYGANLGTGEITPCQDTQCSSCQVDYTQCAGCETANFYYLNQTSFSCILNTAIIDSYGPQLSDGTIQACATPHCLKCKTDNLVCTGCDVPNLYYLKTADATCIYYSMIDDSMGPNLATGIVEVCTEAHCQLCKSDKTACTGCDTTNHYFLNTTDNTCLLDSTIIGGFGADLATGHISPCSDANCLTCNLNYLQCQACDTSNLYYLNTSAFTCTFQSLIPATYGANVTSGTIDPCVDTHCLLCRQTNLECRGCDTANFYYLNQTSSTCIHRNDIITGYGAKLSNGEIDVCTDANCLDCRSDNQVCAGCNTANFYYLDSTSGTCILNTNIVSRFGPNLATGVIESCADANCVACNINKDVCTACDLAGDYFQDQATGDCTYLTSIPPGKGANRTTGYYESCWVVECDICQLDSLHCTTCQTSHQYYLNQSDTFCYLNTDIADFFGPNVASGFVEPCADSHCQLCKSSIAQCDFCDVAGGYFYDSLSITCVHYSTLPSGSGGNLLFGSIQACAVNYCTNCQADYSVCVACYTTGGYYLDTATHDCIHTANIMNRFGADTATGLIAACSDGHCLICNDDKTDCTRCDVAALWYMDLAGACIYVNTIPAGYGGNSSTGVIEACWEPGCTHCQASSLVCTVCDTVAGMYLNASSSDCIHYTGIIDYFGADLPSGNILGCSDSNCIQCQQNRLVCTRCDKDNLFYLDTATGTCVYVTAIPGLFGADLTNGVVASCQDTHCLLCQSDYANCTACDTAAQYFLETALGTCTLASSIVDYFGANLTAGTVDRCVASNCLSCKANNLVCTGCDVANYYFKTATGECVYYQDIQAGSGADWTSGTVELCNDLNCVNCKNDVLICQYCDTSSGYYLDTTTSMCTELQTLPAGYGGDPVSGEIKFCQVVGCVDCRSDYRGCRACDTAATYYLKAATQTCILVADIPSNFGAGLSTGEVEPCQDAACTLCQADTTVCTGCDTAAKYYLDTSTHGCVYYSQIPDFFGANTATGSVAACTVAQCKKCQASHQTCQGCDTAAGVYLNSTTNACSSTFPEGYGPDQEAGVIKACQDPNCRDCSADYAACTSCFADRLYYLDGSACTAAQQAPDGFGLDPSTSFLETCQVEFCKDCRFDFGQCSLCYESMGYFLEGSSCIIMDGKLVLKQATPQSSTIDLEISCTSNPILNIDQDSLHKELKKAVTWEIVFLKSVTLQKETINFRQSLSASSTGLLIDVFITGDLQEKAYKVNVSSYSQILQRHYSRPAVQVVWNQGTIFLRTKDFGC
jgi:hypothetical protein